MVALLLASRPLLLVHVMPWFSLNPPGWHWTMGKTDAARGQVASHDHPLGGIYDSGDPDLIERQTLLMKIAGFDGMLVDWYGDRDRYDYLPNHRATQKLFDAAARTGLSFAVVYEDQTVPNLVSGGAFPKERAVEEGKALFARAEKAWFGSPTYQRVAGKPLVMVFGPQYYAQGDWATILPKDVAFYTLHHRRGPRADGAFDWPLPQDGDAASWIRREAIRRENDVLVPVAYPRFHDFYKAAGVGGGYGVIEDRRGETYRRTLDDALARKPPLVQIATWNDWGEGTQIEPSTEFGYRDLETTQQARRRLDPRFAFTAADLRLPMRLYFLRKRRADPKRLNEAATDLRTGKTSEACKVLAGLG